ncbi:hypothetical protein [Planctomicrobium sp. SH664]|uniref:hypothetical protein n=1 Tax=Planctomicrobium sp. SH664 TaxID=3448125 RepID=UPI003F5B43EB
MTRLELAVAQSCWEQAVEQERQAHRHQESTRETLTRFMQQQMQSSLLRSAQAELVFAQEEVTRARSVTAEAEATLQQIRTKCQELQAREESLEQLIARQRTTHRLEMLQEQQITMDDMAASRWARSRHPAEEVMDHG